MESGAPKLQKNVIEKDAFVEYKFGILLKVARKACGKNPAQICEELGISNSTFKKFEDGLSLPKREMLLKMYTVYNLSPDRIRQFSSAFELSNDAHIVTHSVKNVIRVVDKPVSPTKNPYPAGVDGNNK